MRSALRAAPAAWAAAVVLALIVANVAAGQAPAGGQGMNMQAAPARQADFQPHIFWAYGIACALLFLFMLWTLAQARRTRARLQYLEERLERAYPGRGGATPP